MRQISLTVNGRALVVEAEPEKPLLWVLREDLGLTGAKYGCGMALCGCCTVHLNGDAIRSCVTPLSRAEGKTVITIEGLSRESEPPGAASLARDTGPSMRLLPTRADDVGGLPAGAKSEPERHRH